MKKLMPVIVLTFFLLGCSDYSGQGALKNFLVHPETWLKDPHFTEYKENRDELESAYLNKEITYAEYVKQKEELDERYDAQVKERNKILSSQ